MQNGENVIFVTKKWVNKGEGNILKRLDAEFKSNVPSV